MRPGVMAAWRLVGFPSNGQFSNVSAFVLPHRRPAVDDGTMGVHDDSELVERLLNIVELQARALSREAAQHALDARNGQVLRELQEDPVAFHEFVDKLIGTYKPPVPKQPHHYRPHEREYRVWKTFRAHFQKLERDIRRDLRLKPDDELSRETMYANGGEHPKKMTRMMVEGHGLQADCWPPSTWPEESPLSHSGQLFDLS